MEKTRGRFNGRSNAFPVIREIIRRDTSVRIRVRIAEAALARELPLITSARGRVHLTMSLDAILGLINYFVARARALAISRFRMQRCKYGAKRAVDSLRARAFLSSPSRHVHGVASAPASRLAAFIYYRELAESINSSVEKRARPLAGFTGGANRARN